MVKIIVFENGEEVFREDAEWALVILDKGTARYAMLKGSIDREGMIKTIGKGIAKLLVGTCPGNVYDASREIGQLIQRIRAEGAIEECKKYVERVKRC